MKKIISIILTLAMLMTTLLVTSCAQTTFTWDANATASEDGVIIEEQKASQVSFPSLSGNAVIEFDYEYLKDFNTGFLSYNLIGDTREVFRTTLLGSALGVKTTVYAKEESSTSQSANNQYKYESETLYAKKGKLVFAVDLSRQMILIKHIDGVNKKETMITNDYLWGQNVKSINGFKIGASQNPGIKITSFKAFTAENIEEYYESFKKYTFEEYTADTYIAAGGDFTGNSSNGAMVVSDPENSSNKVAKIICPATFQIRPTKKEFGFNGNVYIKTKVRFSDISTSTRVPNVVQFGGYPEGYPSQTYNSGYNTFFETVATSNIFQAKGYIVDPVSVAMREKDKWYNVALYFNTDTDKVSMYVDDRTIVENMEVKATDFINNLQFYSAVTTHFYIDDVEIGMYKPYSGISAYDVAINPDNTITDLWAGITAEELISAITTDGKLFVKTADGNIREGIIKVGDCLYATDITGNLCEVYTLPEIEGFSYTSAFAALNSENMTASVKAGRTAEDVIAGFNFTIDNASVSILDENGNKAEGVLNSSHIIKVTAGENIFEYNVIIEEENNYIFNWDFEKNITPTDSYINQGNTTGAIKLSSDPMYPENNVLGFITNENNVTGTGVAFARYNFADEWYVSKNAVLEYDFYCDSFENSNDWVFSTSVLDKKYYGAAGSAVAPIYVTPNDKGGVIVYDGCNESGAAVTRTYENVIEEDRWNHISILIRDNFTYDVAVDGRKLNSEPLKFAYSGPSGCTDFEISRIQFEVLIKRGGTEPHVFNKNTFVDNVRISNVNPQLESIKYNPYNNSIRFITDCKQAVYTYNAEDIKKSIKVKADGEEIAYTVNTNVYENYFELLLNGEKKDVYNISVNKLLPDFDSKTPYSGVFNIDTDVNAYPYITSSYGKINFSDKTAVADKGITKEKYLSGIDCSKEFYAYLYTADWTERTGEVKDGDNLMINVGTESYIFKVSLEDAIDYDINWDFEKGVGLSMAGVKNFVSSPVAENLTIGHIADPLDENNMTSGIDTTAYDKNGAVLMRYDTKKWNKTAAQYEEGGFALEGKFVFGYDIYISDYNENDDTEIRLSHSMWKYFGAENPQSGIENYDYNPIIDIRVKSNGELVCVEGERDTSENPNGNSVYQQFGKIIPKNTWSRIAIHGLGDNTYNLYLNGEKLNNAPISYRITESDNNKNELAPDRFYVLMEAGNDITPKKVLIDNVKAYNPLPILDGATYIGSDKTLEITVDNSDIRYEFDSQSCQKAIEIYADYNVKLDATLTFDKSSGKIKAVFNDDVSTEKLKLKITDLKPVGSENGLSGTYTYNFSDIAVLESIYAESLAVSEYGEYYANYVLENNTSKELKAYLVLVGYEDKNETKVVEANISEVTLDPGEVLNPYLGSLSLFSTEDDGVVFAKAFITDLNLKPLGNLSSTLD